MRSCLLLIALVFTTWNASAQNSDLDQRIRDYIRQYKDMAMEEQVRAGIPASITLAQGIHETAAGASRLALKANNHFGIKCSRRWSGLTIKHTDDARNECFRRYRSAQESYRDRSHFLTSSPRYAGLFQIPVSDYQGWARGLKAAGYATNPRYAERLIDLIDRYGLDQYTSIAAGQTPSVPVYFASANASPMAEPLYREAALDSPDHQREPEPTLRPGSRIRVEENQHHEASPPPPYGTVVYVNRLKAVYARKGDMPLEYAITHGIRYERLLSYNELDDFPLEEDQYLYLERKHYRGLVPSHQVREGETLRSISRLYGVQLRSLLAFNHLKEGQEPAVGAFLQLQRSNGSRPPLRDPIPEESPLSLEAEATVPEKAPVVIHRSGDPEDFIDKAELESPSPSRERPTVVRPDIPASTPRVPVSSESKKEVQVVPVVKIGETLPKEDPVAETSSTGIPAFMEGVDRIPVPSDDPDPVVETAPLAEPRLVETPSSEKQEAPVPVPEEPVDELDALKARFDRVIYGNQGRETELPEEVKAEPGTPAQETRTVAPEEQRFHQVEEGETVFSISRKYNITITELQRLNGLDFDQVKPGQKLRIR